MSDDMKIAPLGRAGLSFENPHTSIKSKRTFI